ncbi:MAG: VWA domain-containing protein, partial [Candidatus Omnitrophica bacterium]|nr:VWA domain-containing protein [Candidatus Omnitrophota bacterium]
LFRSPKEHIIIAKLRSILKDNTRVKTHKNKDYGDICHKNLYKISTSGKVFQRKQQFNAKKYVVQLLVDASGSMRYDNKCQTACEAVGKIVTNLQDLVDIEILTFNERSLKLKDHKEKKVNKSKMGKIVSTIINETNSNWNNSTLTMEGVKEALKSLNSLKHRNLTKIMVIVTDGQVNYAHSGECNAVFIKLLHKAEVSGIKIVGLGIFDSYIQEWLPKSSIVIDDVKNILPALLTLLKNAIGRRT